MKYFLHDSNAFNDEKVTQLFIKFGYEGVGLFYTILEKLAQQEKPILTDVIKHQLKVGKKLYKVWKFIEEIELISSNNGETFNEQLLNFSQKYQIKKEKNTERIRQWRENQKNEENVTRYESVSNTPKVNKSKVNKSKDIPSLIEFKNYALENENEIDLKSVELKYKAWVANNWKDGKDKSIKNWKSKLLNTLTYLPKNEKNKQSESRYAKEPSKIIKTTWD